MTSVTKFMLESLTPEQNKEYHSIDNNNVHITSPFFYQFRKSTWVVTKPEKLRCNPEAETSDTTTVSYTINNTFHFLLYVYMRCCFPAVRVKNEYTDRVRICWPHNLGTAIHVEAQLKINEIDKGSLPKEWLDAYFQFYMKPGFRKRHNLDIGNTPILENWQTYLPAYTTNVDHPWFYSWDTALGFPIIYKTDKDTVHRYVLQLHVKALLRMQILINGEWVPCEEVNCSYLEGIDNKTTISIPELWGRYAMVSDKEISWNTTCRGFDDAYIEAKSEEQKKMKWKRTYYIKDVVKCEAANTTTYGKRAEVDLQCTDPSLAYFWMATNVTGSKYHCFSNYTTDPHNIYDGWDPIGKTSVSCGTNDYIKDMDSDHFTGAEARKHFPSPPAELGYHAYSSACNSASIDVQAGIIYSGLKARLVTTISNNDIFQPNKKLESKTEDPEFQLCVILLVMRPLTVTQKGDNLYEFDVKE